MKPNRFLKYSLVALALVASVLAAAWIWLPGYREEAAPASAVVNAAKLSVDEQIAHGAYLAKAGDCFACHTSKGQALCGRT